MRKIFRFRWMPAAILTCGLLTTSCDDVLNVIDNSSTVPEEASAVDNGKWTIDESFVDTSVKPGDDFYMYRIGKWWAATTVDDNAKLPLTAGFLTDLEAGVAQLTTEKPGSAIIFYNHLNALLDQTQEPIMATNALVYTGNVYTECGYNQACKEAEAQNDPTPIWKAMGRLMAKGAPIPFMFQHLGYEGKTILVMYIAESLMPYAKSSLLPDNLRSDGQFVKALVPLTPKAGTRGLDESKWPHLVAMVKEAGIDPADVYLWSESSSYYNLKPDVLKWIEENTQIIKDLNNCSPVNLEIQLQKYASEATVLYSYENYQKVVDSYRQSGLDFSINNIYTYFYNNFMQYEVSHDVGVKNMTSEMRQEGIERSKELIYVFAERIKANQWLSDEGKKVALEKLDNMIINVGCPEKWITEAIPDLSNSQSPVEDSYLLRKAAFNFSKYVAGKPLKETSFHLLLEPSSKSSLALLNAYYTPYFNAINIYPWWLMMPLYDPTQNQAINYAFLAVTAHEITHGFDSQGCKYNKNGDYVDLFTNAADKDAFDQLSKQLIDRFNELDIMVIPGEKSHGEFCLAENIADLGGVEIAFDAYTRYLENHGFKGEEMARQQASFFCAFTELYREKYGPNFAKYHLYGNPYNNTQPDIHSLDRERINGTFRNIDAWYHFFDVQPGDKLYLAPADRVHIW